MDRKTFLNRLVRLSLLGVLALLTGFLAVKRNVKGRGVCNYSPVCNACSELAGCRKPEAIPASLF